MRIRLTALFLLLILFTNIDIFSAYAQISNTDSEIEKVHNDINKLKDDVTELKTTTENNSSMLTATWASAIGTIGGLAVAVVVMFTGLRYNRKQIVGLQKQIQASTLVEIHGLLNSAERKNTRYAVYEAYNKFKKSGFSDSTMFDDVNYKKNASLVRDDFQQIGSLIKNNLIPKEAFLDAFCITIIMCWKSLQKNIEKTEQHRGVKNWLPQFKWLYDEAKKHWKTTHDDKTPLPEPPIEFDSVFDQIFMYKCPICNRMMKHN